MVRMNISGLPGEHHQAGPHNQELDAAVQSFTDYGFSVPPDTPPFAFIAGVSWSFAPQEMPPASALNGLSQRSKAYFAHTVQPELQRAAAESDIDALLLAHQIGRVIGAEVEDGEFKLYPPLRYANGILTVDGEHIPNEIDTGLVIEYGLGINGIVSHLANLKAGAYILHAIHKDRGETALLNGILSYHAIPDEQARMVDGGIARGVNELLRPDNQNKKADLIIASQVYDVGTELRHGVTKGSDLLRPGGLLVARGLRTTDHGLGYDKVLNRIRETRQLEIIKNKEYGLSYPSSSVGSAGLSRLIVARRRSI